MHAVTLMDDRLIDLEYLSVIPAERIPAALTQLAAAQAQLAARLLAANDSDQPVTTHGKLLDVFTASERMGCSTHWLYRHASELPFVVRVGRSLRFWETGLEKWIRSRSGR